MTHRVLVNLPPLRRVAGAFLVLMVLSGMTGCISLSGMYPTTGESGAAHGDDSENGSDTSEPKAPDSSNDEETADQTERTSSVVSGDDARPEEERLLRVTREYWLQTPWFGVSSIILTVKRLPAPSVIVVPPGSLLEETMRPLPEVVPDVPGNHRKSRVRVSVSFHLGDVPPFVDADRYANPEYY
jgi:hypothetical protein